MSNEQAINWNDVYDLEQLRAEFGDESKFKRSVASKYMYESGLESIPFMEFYRAVFPSGELAAKVDNPKNHEDTEWLYNGVIKEFDHKRKQKRLKRVNKETVEVVRDVPTSRMILDDLNAIELTVLRSRATGNFCCLSPISYCGRRRYAVMERFMYAVVIEIDNLITKNVPGKRENEQTGLMDLLHQWKNKIYVPPTAVVCSGNGVHLYWFLEEPVPLFGDNQTMTYETKDGQIRYENNSFRRFMWDEFRKKFTRVVWNNAVSEAPIQQEYHGQAFRAVGSISKKGHLVEAFWVSKKRYSITDLWEQKDSHMYNEKYLFFEPEPREYWDLTTKKDFDLTKRERSLTNKQREAIEKYPKWAVNVGLTKEQGVKVPEKTRRLTKRERDLFEGQWHVNPRVYEWYKNLIQQGVDVGYRYWRLFTLAEYGRKCKIPYEEVKKDVMEMADEFREKTAGKEPLQHLEVLKALQDGYFGEKSHLSEISFINEKAHLNIEKSQRNGNTRWEHLQADVVKKKNMKTGVVKRKPNDCKINREFFYREAVEEGRVGRPAGSGEKKDIVKKWREENPNGKKVDCARETNLDSKTIRKWWDA